MITSLRTQEYRQYLTTEQSQNNHITPTE